MLALQIQDGEGRAHGLKEIENGGARGIQAHIGDKEIGSGSREAAAIKKTAEERSPGTSRELACKATLPEPSPRPWMAMVRPRFNDVRAEEFEGEFGVIARGGGFGDLRFAFGKEAGEENGGFYLGAGHGHFVMNGLEFAAADFERREIAFAAGCPRPSEAEG